MGWSFSCDRNFKKEDQVKQNLRGFSAGYEVLGDSVVGNNHWILLKTPEGKKIIYLALMQSGYPDHGWGYKGMTEESGPNELNCPLKLLNQCDETDSTYAKDWRRMVREYHAHKSKQRKARQSLQKGDELNHDGKSYLLEADLGRLGWSVRRISDGAVLRVSSKHLKAALAQGLIRTQADQEADRKAAQAARDAEQAKWADGQQGLFTADQTSSATAEHRLSLGDAPLVFED